MLVARPRSGKLLFLHTCGRPACSLCVQVAKELFHSLSFCIKTASTIHQENHLGPVLQTTFRLVNTIVQTSKAMESGHSKTDFWNVNVPPELQTEECPAFLRYALTNEKDQRILSTPDSEYHPQTWSEVKGLIRDNRLDLFERLPSDLRRYREYCWKLERDYGSVSKMS